MAYQPGDLVEWHDVDNPDPAQRFWRPGTVKLICCQASIPGGLLIVVDEAGLGHNYRADRDLGLIRPRA